MSSNMRDMEVEFNRHNNDDGCPAGGVEHRPIFMLSLLQLVNFALPRNLKNKLFQFNLFYSNLTVAFYYLSMFLRTSVNVVQPRATWTAPITKDPVCKGSIFTKLLPLDHTFVNSSSCILL